MPLSIHPPPFPQPYNPFPGLSLSSVTPPLSYTSPLHSLLVPTTLPLPSLFSPSLSCPNNPLAPFPLSSLFPLPPLLTSYSSLPFLSIPRLSLPAIISMLLPHSPILNILPIHSLSLPCSPTPPLLSAFLSPLPFFPPLLSLSLQMAQQDLPQSAITENLVANIGASAYAQPGSSWGYPTQTTTDMNGALCVCVRKCVCACVVCSTSIQ